MDRYYNASDAESRALNAGASVLLVPIKPQPPSWVESQIEPVGGKWFSWIGDHPSHSCESKTCAHIAGGGTWTVTAPFAPGDMLHCREAACYFRGRWVYRADTRKPDEVMVTDPMPSWIPSSRANQNAIRHHYPITSVSALRVAEISEEDAVKAGFRESEPMIDEELEALPTNELELASHLGPGVFTAKLDLMMFWSERYPKLPFESTFVWKLELSR